MTMRQQKGIEITYKRCGSSDIIKNGFTKYTKWDLQLYYCYVCKRGFSVRCEKRARVPEAEKPTSFIELDLKAV